MTEQLSTRELLEENVKLCLVDAPQTEEAETTPQAETDEAETTPVQTDEPASETASETAPETETKTPAPETQASLPEIEPSSTQNMAPNVLQKVEERFSQNAEWLKQNGIENASMWLKHLLELDEKMRSNPVETLAQISATYGVQQNATTNGVEATKSPQSAQKMPIQEVEAENQKPKLNASEYQALLGELKKIVAYQQRSVAQQKLHEQLSRLDNEGRPCFPHHNEVKGVVEKLLLCGQARSVDDAYQQALWLNPKIREQMMQDYTLNAFKTKSQDAEKAKEASIVLEATASKPVLSHKNQNGSLKSTRELLEEAWSMIAPVR